MQALSLLLIVLVFSITSCSNEFDIVPQVRIDDSSIESFVTVTFENTEVSLSEEIIFGANPCEKEYKLLDNGDYSFTYVWPFQTAHVVVHNSDECQFGNPEGPVLQFVRRTDNTYECLMRLGLIYVKNQQIQTTTVTGNFAVIKQ